MRTNIEHTVYTLYDTCNTTLIDYVIIFTANSKSQKLKCYILLIKGLYINCIICKDKDRGHSFQS